MIEDSAARRDLSDLRINRDAARSRWGARAIFVVFCVFAVAAFLLYRYLGQTKHVPVVQTSAVRQIGAGETSAILSAGGYILPDRKADVSFKAFGKLEWIGVETGSKVKKDQILARLANADLAAEVDEAGIAVKEAERELNHWKPLVDSGQEPQSRLEKLETTLEMAQARLKRVQAAFEQTLLRAPFDGVVVRKNAQLYETVGPAAGSGSGSTGTSVCTVVDRSSLEMVADVNETNIAKVHEGQEVEVAADALPDKKYRGQVRQVVPTADRQKGVIQVKIRLLDLDDTVLPEMAARATFLRKRAGSAVRVMAPRGAVRERGGRKVVLVVEDSRIRQVAVESRSEDEDGAEIVKGLSGGELVVVGGDAVDDGAEVRVTEMK